MTPNELRIGNYVRIKDSGEIVRVCAITRRKVGFHAPGERPNAQLRYRKLCEIDPVNMREVKNSLPRIHSLVWVDKPLCLYYYYGKIISALHELQNIHYALKGEEIEIEL